MKQEVIYSNTEAEWSKELSFTDNFPMPGRRQLYIALAAAVLAIIASIVLGYYLFNTPASSTENPKAPQGKNIKQ